MPSSVASLLRWGPACRLIGARRPIVPLLAAAALTLSNAARAEEETKTEEKKEAKHEERRGAADLELIIGAGKVDAINPVANGLTGQLAYERRLTDVSERLKGLRAELQVADEQLAFFAEAADDARLRALVSETPLAEHEHHEAQKHADAMARHRADVLASISELQRSQDELLDRLVSEPS